MPTARQRPIVPKDNGYIDRKTICFKHIRELAVKHSPRWSLALRLKISPSDRICFLFTMTDNTRYAAKTRFLKQTKPRIRETFYKDEQADQSAPVEAINRLVEPDGIEPTTSCLQSTRSPN